MDGGQAPLSVKVNASLVNHTILSSVLYLFNKIEFLFIYHKRLIFEMKASLKRIIRIWYMGEADFYILLSLHI